MYTYTHANRPCTVFKVHSPSEHLIVFTPAGLRSSTSEMFCVKCITFIKARLRGGGAEDDLGWVGGEVINI